MRSGVKYVTKLAPLVLIPVLLSVALIWLGVWTAGWRDFAPNTGITAHWDFSKTFSSAWEADTQCLVLLDDDGDKTPTAPPSPIASDTHPFALAPFALPLALPALCPRPHPHAGKPLFTEGDLRPFNFYEALALFFPSVTGIMAGVERMESEGGKAGAK